MTGGELFDRIVEKGSYSEKDAADLIKQVCQVNAESFQLSKKSIIFFTLLGGTWQPCNTGSDVSNAH